jgi:hypothetical protein
MVGEDEQEGGKGTPQEDNTGGSQEEGVLEVLNCIEKSPVDKDDISDRYHRFMACIPLMSKKHNISIEHGYSAIRHMANQPGLISFEPKNALWYGSMRLEVVRVIVTITRRKVGYTMKRIQKPRLYKVARFHVFVLRYEWMVHHVYQGQPLLRLELQ